MTKGQLIVLYVVSAAAILSCFFVKPIAQDPAYHYFADTRTLLGIPNFWNVISNVPFAIVGVSGLLQMKLYGDYPLKANYAWFFIGIVLTGFGSGYYHWHPNDDTLVWDRLPMTISFMSFLSVIIGEFIHAGAGKKLLYPLMLVGLASIGCWMLTDDLRMYALVQFLPILLILIILFLSKKERPLKKYFWLIVVCYTIAKFLESYDVLIFNVTFEVMSGHALKHLAAALAPFFFYQFIDRKFNSAP